MSAFSGDLTDETQWDSYCDTHQKALEGLAEQLSNYPKQLTSVQKALQDCTEAQQALQQSLDKFSATENKEIPSFIQINQTSLQDIDKLNNKQQDLETNHQNKLNYLNQARTSFSGEKEKINAFNKK